ncbi:HD-GYP domain-containing protein [Proteiniborus sp. MB09-C3]|uniref:HD-GYP domain-containing protein n=1 Tax=Proteiniborus sp. MB09-C3 TaxID=3050072 RepID=UPI0025579EE6|nr:HD-GYP domain-containing protein [Proteiniborus sp. MB09-C3]WIV11324.1 HD-GYP domain-containing protein [Proteiniborus sp. MB09-C3]
MALLNIDEVKVGMVINKNIDNEKTGAILLTSGTVLNRNNILTLKSLGVKNIDVYLNKNNENDFLIIDNDGFTEKYNRFANKTRTILFNARFGKKLAVNEIGEIINEMIEEVIKSNNILGTLRQIEEDDDYTFQHSIDVCLLAIIIGKWLGYSKVELKQLSLAGLFHDIGKVKISDNIIYKPGKLTESEFELVKKHTILGYNLLDETVGISKNVALGALQHHEREDGSGYPMGVKSKKIHEYAKIIAICDIFDAMTTERVYKEKQSPFLVAEQIFNDSFVTLDPRIATTFINNISKFYVGNVVKLNSGDIGEVIYIHKQMPTRPIVKVEDKFIDLLTDRSYYIEDVII